MKTKYLILAIMAGCAAAIYFAKSRKAGNPVLKSKRKRVIDGEKHIRGIMKRAKLAV